MAAVSGWYISDFLTDEGRAGRKRPLFFGIMTVGKTLGKLAGTVMLRMMAGKGVGK